MPGGGEVNMQGIFATDGGWPFAWGTPVTLRQHGRRVTLRAAHVGRFKVDRDTRHHIARWRAPHSVL
jgi:hypothetical protein